VDPFFAIEDAMSGDRSPCPFSMPIIVCMSLLLSFSSSPILTLFYFVICIRDVHSLETFSMGNWRHFVIPSNNQPSISFCVSHHPSPCFSFFTKMGLSSWSSPGSGSGNTVCIPWRTAHVKWVSSFIVIAWVSPMNSSM